MPLLYDERLDLVSARDQSFDRQPALGNEELRRRLRVPQIGVGGDPSIIQVLDR
jgi:hypothetical protein